MRRWGHGLLVAGLGAGLGLGVWPAAAQRVDVPNPSFETGETAPTGWTLSGGRGEWLQGNAADGARAVAVTGSGQDSHYWRSAPLVLEPSALYRLSFRTRNLGAQGGTPVTGPVFCNRDLGQVGDAWTEQRSVFFTPRVIDPGDAWLRFGQWQVTGTVAFDQVELGRVWPVYAVQGDLALGEGEALAGRAYEFVAPFASESRNHSRPLVSSQCQYNTDRWVFGTDSEVVYRFQVGTRGQTGATVDVAVTWYASGALAVEASMDGETWRELGTIGKLGGGSFAIPADLLPAPQVWVRLKARALQRVGTESDPGSLQVGSLAYHATLDGAPAELRGRTRFVAVLEADPRLECRVLDLGDGVPGGRNTVAVEVTNRGPTPVALAPLARVTGGGQAPVEAAGARVEVAAGRAVSLAVAYPVPGPGTYTLDVSFGPEVRQRVAADFSVAELFSASYGETLPPSTERVGLWWASSGWKVARTRPLPTARGEAVLVRAAANETEAAQLVVRPSTPLTGFTATAAALTGPAGAVLPAASVEVLRVRYVDVTRPTDATGVAAPWPDPLPPFRGPLDLAANENQPLWVRVHVPTGTAAGLYSGVIQLRAKEFQADVPVRVEVFGFRLPERMTCQSAFGFSPGTVFRYHGLTEPAQRRAVLDKYLASLGAHHISPYNPAPLDGFGVTWPRAGNWDGGSRDLEQKHAGRSSIRVEDVSPTASASCGYGETLPIPAAGLHLRVWYRTRTPGHRFIVTLNHVDVGGQWMSGRNLDIPVTGDGEWQLFERPVTTFPAGARAVRLTLWATLWSEDGRETGTVWFDDVSVQDAGTGAELVKDGGFEPVEAAQLVPTFDWTAWDRAMEDALSRYQFNTFSVPVVGLGGGTFQSRTEPSLLGFGEASPEYESAFTAYARGLQEHLRAKGWLDEAFVYWFDEPDPKDYEFVMNGFRKLKEAAPDLRRMLTEQVEPALVGGPNLWCPLTPEFKGEQAVERRRQGEQFWWYVCTGPKAPFCTLFIDHPATELRVWLWQTWQRRIDGILVWETTYWTSSCAYPDADRPQDPYADPMGWVSGYDTPAGTKAAWGNGDGRFMYPPEAAADGHPAAPVLDGPVDSIRWEMLRDGIEDYEYLALLQRLLAERGERLDAERRRQFAALLEVPAAISADLTTFTRDPAPLEARRLEVARALESLSAR